MNRFSMVVVAAAMTVASVVAWREREPLGQRGSGPLVPALAEPSGAVQREAGSYRSPGVVGATFQSMGPQTVTVLEEHYRKQLIAAGWKLESTGGDPNIAFSRFAIAGPDVPRAATLVVTSLEGGRAWAAVRLVQSMGAPARPAARTDSEMTDWMLRQLPRPEPAETPVAASTLPGTFPAELLPAKFTSSRIVTTNTRVTVAGTVDGTTPAALVAYFAGLRRAGWSDRLRGWITDTFVVAEFCKDDVRASIVFNVEPKRVLMAGVSTDRPPHAQCAITARRSPGITGPVVVLPAEWSPAYVGGGGGESHWRAGMRLNTATPVVSVLANVEAQIAASGYRVTARTTSPNQSHVRFESTQTPGSPAMVLLSVTKLPWAPQIDVVYEVVARPKQ